MSSENLTLELYLSFLSLVYFYFPVLSHRATEKQPTSLIPGILISSPYFPEHGVSTVSYISLHGLHTGAASFLAQNQIFLVHLMSYIIRKTLFFCSRFPVLHRGMQQVLSLNTEIAEREREREKDRDDNFNILVFSLHLKC